MPRGFQKGNKIGNRFQRGDKNIAKLPEIRKKISEKIKGRKLSEEWKRKLSESHKGQFVSEETKKKLSKIHKKIGAPWMKEYKPSEETKEKISKNNARYWLNKKRKFSKERNEKISKALNGRTGKKSNAWKGGIHREKHNSDWRYIQWRIKVFVRDNWMCQICKKVGVYLEAHHIKSWSKYPVLRYNVQNGITLCRECHKLIHKKNKKV